MSYPGSGGPWQPNDPNQPGSGPFPAQPQQGYPQQGYPQQGYPQQGGYQQGDYPQQAGYQPQPGHPTGPQPVQPAYQAYGQPGYGPGGPQAPRKRKGPVIAAIATVLVIALGVAGTVFFLNRGGDDQAGQANPTEAATNLVNSLSQGDVLGVLESLTPAESALMVEFNARSTQRLKELNVYKDDADPNKLHGASIEAKNLKYDEKGAEKVNDHLTITKLIGGTVGVRADLREMPFTQEFLDAAFPEGVAVNESTNEQVDVADIVKETGQPIRIATVNVDGEWYPSLFYTVADYALTSAGKKWPSTSIPNNGTDDAEGAVKEFVQASINSDVERVIELLPPDEMGALHDAGPALLEEMGGTTPAAGVEISTLETEVTDAESGGKKVMLAELEVTVEGETVKIRRDGDCYVAEVQGENQPLCAEDVGKEIGGTGMSPEMQQALTHLATGMLKNTGVVVTEFDGKWYVSPLRTYTELGLSAMSDLTPEDVIALVTQGR
ncbi:flagellar basal body-associated FliL family protein [Actinophytocola xanthii]|uniref:Flagellar basal body protein FliL n=1 Tax=Actinophytocola xanthii TaxID=1912961 RepID=A0A1Q8CL78_9PSEU|nr:hypothetical protein [Actinophytocola xanthii]OLF15102.1 hypothetical protein BU204_23845 [Actinophytocola xanthii]